MSIEIVKKLKPCKFKHDIYHPISDEKRIHYGFIAQEIEEVFGKDTGIVKFDGEHYSMNYMELIPILTKALQEALEKIEKLENKNVNTL